MFVSKPELCETYISIKTDNPDEIVRILRKAYDLKDNGHLVSSNNMVTWYFINRNIQLNVIDAFMLSAFALLPHIFEKGETE